MKYIITQVFHIKKNLELSAEFDANGVGKLETAHPYGNNELNLYKVRGSGFFEFSFTDFEVDKLDDGSCSDEVWEWV